MSELLSDAEFLGTPTPAAAPSRVSTGRITPAPTKPAEPAPAKPTARVVSDEEFLSGKKDTFKQPTTFDLALQSGVEAAKNLGGSAAVLADMVLSLPGFVMGVGAQAGGTIAAAARGVPLSAPEPQRDPFDKRPQVLNPVTAYGVGREAGHMVSEPFMNPLQKLFTMLKSGDAYSGSSGGKAMEKFGSLVEDAGKWVEERTNGGVSREAVPMLVDTVMASAVGLGAKKPGIDPQAVARMRAQLKDLAADAQSKALERDMAEPAAQSPVARAGQRQVQQQINELLGIVPDEVRAQQAKERRKQVQQAFRSPDQSWQYPGREYDSILESIAKADERMGAEAAWRVEQNRLLLEENARGALDVEARAAEQAKQPERIGQAEILRIMQKPGYERTAEDLITLREARRQGGNVRPEVPLLLSAAGLGAIAGAELSDDDLRGALLGGATGTAMALPFMWRGESVPRSFRQAGAVKEPGGMWHPEAVERLAEPLKNRLIDMQAVDRLSTAELDALHGPVRKQNRAPNPQYLPYVQDFVKEGKWGEVRDLGNAGLRDIGASLRNSPEFARLAEELFPGQRYLSEADARKLQEEGVTRTVAEQSRQRGSIDPQLAIGLGTIGLGALAGYALSEDSPGTGALLGALAGGALALPGAKQRIKQAGELAEFGLGLLSTSIRNLSPAIRLEARRFEMRNLEQAHAYLSRVTPWLKEMQSAPTELRSAIQRNDPNGIAAQMKGNAPLISGWREVRNVLNELGTKLYGEGRFKSMLDDYFPRLVKDFEGLKEALDQPIRTALEKKLEAAEKKAMGMRGFPLTAIERSSIINRELAGYSRPSNVNEPGFTQRRTVKDLTKELEKFYYTPEEALFAYVRGAVEDIEMARFFGKNKVEKTVGGRQLIDVNTSIGNVVGEELARGKITPKDAAKLEELLRDRFEGGQRAPSRYISELRAYMNMGLLGNLASASVQIADTAMPAYAQSIRSAMTAAARTVAGRNRVSAKDFGLADHIAEEFVGGGYQAPSLAKKILVRGALPAAGAVAGAVLGEDIGGAAVGAAAGATLGSIATVGMANTLNKVFKYSGFSAVDRFGKTVHLEAALDRWSRATRSEKGMTQLREKYGEAFRDSFPQLVQDLKTGKLSEDVRLLLFSELSDFQPISKLEMPQAYLRHPNGRLYYTLKSFMLKQFDIVRRDALQEIHKGFTQEGQRHRVATGLKNLTAYATVLGISGAGAEVVRQWILGEPVHFDKTDIMENVLKTFGWAQWTRDMWAKGERTKAVLGQAIPPYRLMDDIINKDPKAIQQIPVLGKLYYKWELGGREEAELREAKKAKKEGKEYDLSSRAEEYKERKRDRLKERREARRERE